MFIGRAPLFRVDYVALRFAGIRHKSRIIYRGGTLVPDGEENLSMKNKFWGVGPLFGVEGLWGLNRWMGLFARGGGSLLWGRVYLHQDEDTPLGTAKFFDETHGMQQVGEMGIGFDFIPTPPQKLGFRLRQSNASSSIENDLILLILGRFRSANFDSFRVAQNQLLRWCGYRNRYRCLDLSFRIGWELYFLPGENRLARFVDQAKYVRSDGDLMMQGLTLGLGVDF